MRQQSNGDQQPQHHRRCHRVHHLRMVVPPADGAIVAGDLSGLRMSDQLVSDEAVQRALDWLVENASEIGNSKREAVKAEHMLKHVKALVMSLHKDLPVSAQEREAVASDEYLEALELAAKAAGEFEKMKSLREAAALRIEVWRSMGANYRAMKI